MYRDYSSFSFSRMNIKLPTYNTEKEIQLIEPKYQQS